jgi:probable rRNA maturation factor
MKMKNLAEVHLQIRIAEKEKKKLPKVKQFEKWVLAAMNETSQNKLLTMTIRIVDEKESAKLNKFYRKKNCATNVLSFELGSIHIGNKTILLGDLVICAPVIFQEAKEQNKELLSHFAHITVHGVLHILGFDHKTAKQRKAMESLEIKIMEKLGIANPYG